MAYKKVPKPHVQVTQGVWSLGIRRGFRSKKFKADSISAMKRQKLVKQSGMRKGEKYFVLTAKGKKQLGTLRNKGRL